MLFYQENHVGWDSCSLNIKYANSFALIGQYLWKWLSEPHPRKPFIFSSESLVLVHSAESSPTMRYEQRWTNNTEQKNKKCGLMRALSRNTGFLKVFERISSLTRIESNCSTATWNAFWYVPHVALVFMSSSIWLCEYRYKIFSKPYTEIHTLQRPTPTMPVFTAKSKKKQALRRFFSAKVPPALACRKSERKHCN